MTAGMKRAAPDEGFNPHIHLRPASLFYNLDRFPLGSWDSLYLEQINDSLLPCDSNWSHRYLLGEKEIADRWWPKNDRDHSYVSLRVACEQYAKNRNSNEKESLLKKVEALLIQLKKEWFPLNGVALPYNVLNKFSLVRLVYTLEDDLLTNLFASHLPIPSSIYFTNCKVPAFITKIEDEKNAAVRSFIEKNKDSDLKAVEKSLLLIQRIIRSNRRKEEEKHRLKQEGPPIIGPLYVPKCEPLLAERIVRLSRQALFLQFIRHISNSNALLSIFDGALYGRKSLLRHYIPFSPAALNWVDIENGDSDVICFAGNHGIIDPAADGNIEFVLDLKKIDFSKNASSHYAFFKQRDLTLAMNETNFEDPEKIGIRSLQITPEKKFLFESTFSPPGSFSCKYEDGLDFFENAEDASIDENELISYDIANINAVLILTFFKFLDDINSPLYEEFYSDISEMSDERLLELLNDIGKNISMTMEFNFCGAHQIDFDSLESITEKEKNFSLHVPSLIQELQIGKVDLYRKAKGFFPTLFLSYRFIDYLISKTDNTRALELLSKQRLHSKAPSLPSTPISKIPSAGSHLL